MTKTQQELLRVAEEKFDSVEVIGSLYSMTFEYASESFASQLGYTQEELQDKRVGEVLGIDQQQVRSLSLEFLAANDTPDEQVLIKKDGSKAPVRAVVSGFKHDGEEFMVVREITFL